MENFIKGLDEEVVAGEVKDNMLRDGFNRTFIKAYEGIGSNSYAVSTLESKLSTLTPVEVINLMVENGFSLILDNGGVRLTHHIMNQYEDVTYEEVSYKFLDTI